MRAGRAAKARVCRIVKSGVGLAGRAFYNTDVERPCRSIGKTLFLPPGAFNRQSPEETKQKGEDRAECLFRFSPAAGRAVIAGRELAAPIVAGWQKDHRAWRACGGMR